MSNIRQVRNRIRSVKNIQQITRAMKMVASARLRKAQSQLMQARPYALKLREVIADVAVQTPEDIHPLLREYDVPRYGKMVVTSDKGLCGGFNIQTLQRAAHGLEAEVRQDGVDVLAVGRKSVDFFRRSGVKAYKAWAGFWQEFSWLHADAIAQEVITAYTQGRWSRVVLVYNRFKSALAQEVVEVPLLPLSHAQFSTQKRGQSGEYLFEPSPRAIYEYLLPRYVKISIWHAFLESKAAELAARMQAMDNATESAGEMIAELTLHMNRARQASITTEISELVGSAEAIGA